MKKFKTVIPAEKPSEALETLRLSEKSSRKLISKNGSNIGLPSLAGIAEFKTIFFLVILYIILHNNTNAHTCYIDTDSSIVVIHNKDMPIYRLSKHLTFDPFEYPRLCEFGKGSIYVLLGTSTAGKTTLIDAIRKSNPQYLDYGIDISSYRYKSKQIQNFFPEEYNLLQNIAMPHDLPGIIFCGNQNKFKEDITGKKDSIENSIEIIKNNFKEKTKSLPRFSWKETCKDIIQLSKDGYSTILDVVGISMLEDFFSFHFYAPIQIHLVFCPLSTLAERMIERNDKAKRSGFFSNMRDTFPLWQYTELYKPKSDEKDEILEVLNKYEVCRIFDTYLSMEGQSAEELEAQRNKFLFALGFHSARIETVEITSRFKFYTRNPLYKDYVASVVE